MRRGRESLPAMVGGIHGTVIPIPPTYGECEPIQRREKV